MARIEEATCRACGETFVPTSQDLVEHDPDGEPLYEHLFMHGKHEGELCGGLGPITSIYGKPEPSIKLEKRAPRMATRQRLSHVIKVDQDVYDVIRSMKISLEQSGYPKPTLNESLKCLLSHRQPGGWEHMVSKARKHLGLED